MSEDDVLKKFPELDYIRQWSEAVDSGDYFTALAVINKGLQLSLDRKHPQFVNHFLKLKELTSQQLSEDSLQKNNSQLILRKYDQNISCSFCGKAYKDAHFMLAGAKAYICNECTELCYDVLLRSNLLNNTEYNS